MISVLAIATLAIATRALAAPPTTAELATLCKDAEDQAHCGRLVEARRLRPLARILERDGDELRVSLSPSGMTVFRDEVWRTGAKSYAVWDYLEPLDTVVLFTTDGDRSGFLLLQRKGGGEFRVPSEPVFSADSRRFVTADFCDGGCDNQVALWRIGPDGVRKDATWSPAAPWSDVTARWIGSDAIALDYTVPNDASTHTLERRLGDPSWKRTPAR